MVKQQMWSGNVGLLDKMLRYTSQVFHQHQIGYKLLLTDLQLRDVHCASDLCDMHEDGVKGIGLSRHEKKHLAKRTVIEEVDYP
jgi:hypothetical protein